MTFKEFIIPKIQMFFFLVTMILMAQVILGNAIEPDRVLYYKDFSSTFVIAFLCMLPTVVLYSKKELSINQMIIRHAIQFALIETIMLTLAITEIDNSSEKLLSVILIAIVTAVIYTLAIFMMWYRQRLESKKLTELLKNFQNNQ